MEKNTQENRTLSEGYIMDCIDRIMQDNQHISKAIDAIERMTLSDSPNGGYGDAGRAEAIKSAVLSRETTNQKLIGLLEKMVDEMNGAQSVPESPANAEADGAGEDGIQE